MYKGQQRFNFFLHQLEEGFKAAATSKNPALSLYQNKVRTPLFMLEGLCRLHANFQHPNKFTRLKERFKMLEDGIGSIDYYDNAFKDLQHFSKVPAFVGKHLQHMFREKIQHLNKALEEGKWINRERERFEKIRKKATEIKWLPEETEVLCMEEAYRKTIKGVERFGDKTGFQFDNMEEDVHELRRKLRWLSIYAHVLRGTAQLASLHKPSAILRSYHTDSVVQSPFNQLPAPADHRCFLLLDRNYFLALSWIIERLGQLKDEGLMILAVKEAIQEKEMADDEEAIQRASRMLGKRTNHLQVLLQEASTLTKRFFRQKILDGLVIGVVQPLESKR